MSLFSRKTKLSCEYNEATFNSLIEKVFYSNFRRYDNKSKDKVKIDKDLEKDIIKQIFDQITGPTLPKDNIGYYEKTTSPESGKRTIQMPNLFIEEISNTFKLDDIVFYGSLSLDKDLISDYDLKYIPQKIDNFHTHMFNEKDLNKMYSFMNKLRKEINERCTDIKLPVGYKHINPDENADSLVRLTYNESNKSYNEPIQYLSNQPNNSNFKISIIPDLYLFKNSGKTVRFILFRIKYVINEEKNNRLISIPVLDLSYHFCEDANTLTYKNYEKFKDDIYIIKNYEDDFYEQMFTEFKKIDEMETSQLSDKEIDEKIKKIQERMSKYLPQNIKIRSRQNNFKSSIFGGSRKTNKKTLKRKYKSTKTKRKYKNIK